MSKEQRIRQILEASSEYVRERGYMTGQLDVAFIDGVEWADEHPKEEPVSEELEEAAVEWFNSVKYKSDLSGTPINAFKAGANWKEQQMMSKAFEFTKEHNTACILASECLRNQGWFSREHDFNNLFRHLSCVDELFKGKFSGKTKVIVIKEE